MENFLWSLGTIIGQGAIYSTVPGTIPFRPVATRDIAEAAADVLLSEPGGHRAINVLGPAEVTYHGAAAILSEAAGGPIAYVQVPQAPVRAGALQSGLSENFADELVELESAMASRLLVPEPQYPSRYGSTTLAQFARTVFAPALLEAGYKPKQS